VLLAGRSACVVLIEIVEGGYTQPKSKHIRQRSGRIEDHMKLACLQKQIPSCDAGPIRPFQSSCKPQQPGSIEHPQQGPHHKLRMLEADNP